ncbi:TPM domain-containing protein [Streptococcus ovis]|uniref:TPM domain-containing protein n=1 Tax=Streptococcus ovis TaxID=82806 RepID=UPI000369D07A|nr:TPM domain-containing protein [Streptococcus ovis]
MKKLGFVLIAFLLSLVVIMPVYADETGYIRDCLTVLDATEDAFYEKEAQRLASDHQLHVYFLAMETSAENMEATISRLYEEIGSQKDAVILALNYETNVGETYFLGSSKERLKLDDDQFLWKAYHAEHTIQDGIESYFATIQARFEVPPRLVDEADLLSQSEEEELLTTLDEISTRQKMDVVVATVNGLRGKTAEAFADDFFDYHNYGQGDDHDGILLLVSMEDRDWHLSTSGTAIRTFTDAGLNYMSDSFLPFLSSGDVAQAFSTYAGLADQFITQAKTDKPYDVGNLPKEPFNVLLWGGASLLTGIVVAWGYTAWLKGQLTSVRPQIGAQRYVKEGSFRLTKSQDLFLYRTVNRHARPKSSNQFGGGSGGSSIHISSSGHSHGGSGGKF